MMWNTGGQSGADGRAKNGGRTIGHSAVSHIRQTLGRSEKGISQIETTLEKEKGEKSSSVDDRYYYRITAGAESGWNFEDCG